jgi:membrane protease YdiL (CAAX protease family)
MSTPFVIKIDESEISAIHTTKSRQFAGKFGLSVLLLATSALFFLGDHLLASGRSADLTAIPAIILLGLTVFFYLTKNLRKYWEVTFAFFCGTFGLYLAWSPLNWPAGFLGADLYTAKGITVYKFSEILAVTLPIILLTWLVQRNLAPIYLQKGNLKIGLGLGLGFSLLIFGVYLLTGWSKIDFEKVRLALFWMLIFAFMDALFEVLLLQGLLLRRFIGLLGNTWAIILSTLVYGLFILGVGSATRPISYGGLILFLPLGFLYSYIMQKSDAIWGSLCVHATIDLIYLFGVFAST